MFFFTDTVVLILNRFILIPWKYIDIKYFPLYIIFHVIFRSITTGLYFIKIEKVLKKINNVAQNDIIEKFKINEEIINEEFKIFLLIKIVLLYLMPLLLTAILSAIGTALMTIFYFLVFLISLLYCFYSFIKIEDNPLNSVYYISIYLLQYILFIFIILHF